LDLDQIPLDKSYLWRRPIEYLGKREIKLFGVKIDPTDIRLGVLRNAYFGSALSAMAENPLLITRLFEV